MSQFSWRHKQTLKFVCISQLFLLVVGMLWAWLRNLALVSNMRPDMGIIYGLGGGIALSLGGYGLEELRLRHGDENLRWLNNELLRPTFADMPWLGCFIVALLSGFCEELFFRGVLAREIGLYGSSIIFGLLHTFHRKLIVNGIETALIGLLFAWIYQETNNLLPIMAMHFANNLTSLWLIKKRH